MLAFLMNTMGNILSMYNTFQTVTAASANCDYGQMAYRMGILVKRLYNVQPIERDHLEPMDALAHTELYKMADLIYSSFRSSLLEQRDFFEKSAVRESYHLLSEQFDMDSLYKKYFVPVHKHEDEYLDISVPRGARSLINGSAVVTPHIKRKRVVTYAVEDLEEDDTVTKRSKSESLGAASPSPPPPTIKEIIQNAV
jgi:hypothetical protein